MVMKLLHALLILCFLHCTTSLCGQYYKPARIFKKDQADAWMGVGLLPTYTKDASRISVPPVSIGLDWLVSDQFSLGASGGYSFYQIEKLWPGDTAIRRYSTQTLQIMGRAAAHYTRADNLDLYGGIQLGGQFTLINSLNGPFGRMEELHGIKPKKFRMQYGALFGVRFAVSRKSVVWSEFGTGISFIQVGYGIKVF